ncbi:calcium/sodium antiporter [Ahrensia sp. R2A130]|uniref:calcium/sodium antiporter n=1 Tax=Ahrensia sp. R2A130 TaxID=744979 RepID=UPI0001E09421|nr:calcium/sodium antiporter [Ahrensia sp. R2A130]EFL90578.1 putative K+-dependent Na+/Ca+ exchanger family protein [Ahrensia sp. R2A130]
MLVYLLLALGLVLLVFGGDWLVKGAVGLANRYGISPLIIGLTIVAFGTSAPELVVSLDAAWIGKGGLAVGNVVGSNIANVLLVLSVPAFFAALNSGEDDTRVTLGFLAVMTIGFMIALQGGEVSQISGLILLAGLFLFLGQQFLAARKQSANDDMSGIEDEVGEIPTDTKRIAMLLIAGALTLPLAAWLTVDNAVAIATIWNVPEEIIGLTIVAIGTSLPELATSIQAARQGNSSVAIGNVIGSNLFNIAAIMGITAAVAGPIPVASHVVTFDIWIMAAATVFLIALTMFKGVRIGKRIGGVLLASYVAYLVATVML